MPNPTLTGRRSLPIPAWHGSWRKWVLSYPALLVIAAGWLGAGGCGTGNPHARGTFAHAAYLNEKGKHHEAVTELETFVRRNPADSLAARAQYLKAVSYMELKEYPLAAVELQILRKDYPNSELVAESEFMEAVAYFRQVGRVERDLSGAEAARQQFRKFLQAYPGSSHAEEARDYLSRISDLFVRKRLNAVDVFRQLGNHAAAALTLQTILVEEPQSSLIAEVLWEQAVTAQRMKDPQAARQACERLLAEYPASPLAQAARKRLAELPPADGS